MKRLEAIVNFAKDANSIYAKAMETDITKEEIYYLRKIDPEFDNVCDKLVKLIEGSTQTTQTKISAATSITPTAATPTVPAPSTTTTPSSLTSSALTSIETWKNHPDLNGVEISSLGNVRVNGRSKNTHLFKGYMIFKTDDKRIHSLASAVLTTFKCHRLDHTVPVYKDGNRENCKLSNLEWGIRYNERLSSEIIEHVCKLIAENSKLTKHAMLNLLIRDGHIKNAVTFRNILSGKWKTISNKYFIVVNGNIIPTNIALIKDKIVTYMDKLDEYILSTRNATSDCSAEIWKRHPNLKGVEISNLGNVRINGENVNTYMHCGYMKFRYNLNNYYGLARHVLITFCGNRDYSYVPFYKDNNRENCKLSNLEWTSMKSTHGNIEQVCKFISENPNMNLRAVFKILSKKNIIGSPLTIENIISGKWSDISDKYFIVVDGHIIPTTNIHNDKNSNDSKTN